MNEEKNSKGCLEAILFAAGEPVDVGKLASFLKLKKSKVSEEIEKLTQEYLQKKRGLQIIKKGNTIQLTSSSEYGEMVAKFLDKKLHEPLSKAALEVLAVIAYRGPVTRAQVEHIRGVNCSFSLRNLAIRGILERRENPADARSYLYEASYDFLKKVGLSSIKELPDYSALHEQDVPQLLQTKKEDKEQNNEPN